MPIYEIAANRIETVHPTSFQAEGVRERGDLQRLLRDHIEVAAPGVLVVAEEFGDWDDSRRRIDLLGLDKDANLVVVELKRTDDGGHMDLQAIRYAAMVSAMTFDQVVAAHEAYLAKRASAGDARAAVLEFLDWVEPNASQFAQSVRIVLVAEGFSKEITTAVMWLNQHDLDIRCVRLTPYVLDGRLIVDAQQTIPLPEAAEYQVQIKNKAQQERVARDTQRDYTKYDVTVDGAVHRRQAKNRSLLRVVRALCDRGVAPEQIASLLPSGMRRWQWVQGDVEPEEFKALVASQAQALGRKFEDGRWFIGPDDLIRANGKTYAFSTQWGVGTRELMDSLLAEFPSEGITVQESD